MASYEDIKKANESIKTLAIEHKDKDGNIVSRDYAEVNQRIMAFRMVYPEGFILTELVSNVDGVCVFRAKVGYEDEKGQHTLGTGTAYEKEGSTYINKTSYIENCETSCVGRALGMAGFGIDTSVASAEEVESALVKSAEEPKPAPSPTPASAPSAAPAPAPAPTAPPVASAEALARAKNVVSPIRKHGGMTFGEIIAKDPADAKGALEWISKSYSKDKTVQDAATLLFNTYFAA